MTAPLDIDALHATWKGEWRYLSDRYVVQACDPEGRWFDIAQADPAAAAAIVALHNAWPAIYERLRELEAILHFPDSSGQVWHGKIKDCLAAGEYDQGDVCVIAYDDLYDALAAETARADREAALRQTAEDTLEYLRTRHADGTWSSVTVGDFCTSRAAVAERARTEGE